MLGGVLGGVVGVAEISAFLFGARELECLISTPRLFRARIFQQSNVSIAVTSAEPRPRVGLIALGGAFVYGLPLLSHVYTPPGLSLASFPQDARGLLLTGADPRPASAHHIDERCRS